MALLTLLLTTLLAVTSPTHAQFNTTSFATHNTSSSTACSSLHIIVVRASNESPSQGIIGTLATLITSANPGSTVEWVPYPAELTPYDTSSYNGTLSTTSRLQNYVDSCSQGNIVLLGYSQGAHVIGDVMCGGGLAIGLGPYSPPIAEKYADKVIAMVQMGDPRYMPDLSFNAGTSKNEGLFPRPGNISCLRYADILQSYCDTGDLFCARGTSLEIHHNYTTKYNTAAFNFVQDKIKAKASLTSSSSGGASNTSGSGDSTPSGSTSAAVVTIGATRSAYYISLSLSITLGALFTFGL